jgi:ribosomal-protein-alanine acetyltransferase
MGLDDVPQAMEIASRLPDAPQWPQDVYLNALDPKRTPARIAMVAQDLSGEISGFLITVLVPPQAELETIAVAPAARRQGIGTRLLAEMLTVLKQKHVTEVMLEVRESNHSARSFYAAAGWIENGRRDGYYTDPKENAVLMSRQID